MTYQPTSAISFGAQAATFPPNPAEDALIYYIMAWEQWLSVTFNPASELYYNVPPAIGPLSTPTLFRYTGDSC
jgi:hypothetical protein